MTRPTILDHIATAEALGRFHRCAVGVLGLALENDLLDCVHEDPRMEDSREELRALIDGLLLAANGIDARYAISGDLRREVEAVIKNDA
ncbi:hypothetical protein [Sphingosinicella microcystinivorans]|uniref:hypothetical protein n=1 Tax=Sphingosinicella microcystinivorans TaxID=335406 RepID=UPI0022F3DB40|nr:hypothetical protein [Sphingosinicella microcystinivorans]WBX83005.1 hypothetical protein PE061_14455 [Sphingosinicella microcystinivorans]